MSLPLGTDRITYGSILVNNCCFAWSVHHSYFFLSFYFNVFFSATSSYFRVFPPLSIFFQLLFSLFLSYSFFIPFHSVTSAFFLLSLFCYGKSCNSCHCLLQKLLKCSMSVWLRCLFFKEKSLEIGHNSESIWEGKKTIRGHVYKTQGT